MTISSPMTTITTGKNMVTLINVFTVKQENQQALVDLLIEASETIMKKLPGFISANIHSSLDGTRVTNYAQWQSREAFEAMLQNPDAIPHMQAAGRLAEKAEPHLYQVKYSKKL